MKKLLLLSLLLTACATTPPPAPVAVPDPVGKQDAMLNDLAFYAMSLDGTPYQWGGESPDSGFDCSGFVRHVFQHSVSLDLPRTSRELSRTGVWVPQAQLHPGDLVFFNTTSRAYSHVGIYVGEGRFVHAPRVGKNIRVDSVHNDYWRARYNGARRLL